MPLFATKIVVSWAKKSGVDLGLGRAVLHGFIRLITALNSSDSQIYDGDSMAGSSGAGEQSTRGTDQRTGGT